MILRFVLALVAILLPTAVTAAPHNTTPRECRAIGGLEALWSKPSLRWIVVGEQHGTNEMPAAFNDIVCNAGAAKRPVVVALERSELEQGDIDAFMSSDGGERARAALLRSGSWSQKQMQDGRGSLAYLKLIHELRRMKQAGSIVNVVLFVPFLQIPDPASFSVAEYERHMADRLMKAAASKDALVLAFVGNCHAMRTARCGSKPAAAYLPPAETFTINVEGTGGSVWNCAPHCGVREVMGMSPKGEPRLQHLNDPQAPYDAMLFLGGPVTASPPVAVKVEAATK